MNGAAWITLSYRGRSADSHQIDLYDTAQALMGFQRSLALTTHLVLNGEIITQAPALKGAQILTLPTESSSWKITAVILAGAYTIGTAPKDTPLGNIVRSVYDYVISESLGFHVDYEKSLGQLYEEHAAKNVAIPKIEQHKVDALIEKCSTAITDIHRPIVKTRTATEATITAFRLGAETKIGGTLNDDTYEYIHEVFTNQEQEVISGRISSYNSNTFKGRIYVSTEGRPVAFELADTSRSNNSVQLIVASLSVNAIKDYKNEWSVVHCRVYRNTSRKGHLKSYTIVHVSHAALKQ